MYFSFNGYCNIACSFTTGDLVSSGGGAAMPIDSGVLLENFSGASIRTAVGDPSTNLWAVYTGENPNQSGALDVTTGTFKLQYSTNVVTKSGPYLHFFPKPNNSWAYPNGYAQTYAMSGVFVPTCNRFSFWVKPNVTTDRRSDGGDLMEFGTYIRTHDDPDTANQGNHYYHYFGNGWTANRWHKITITNKPQHQVGGDTGFEWPADTSFITDGIHYFDGMTRFYFDIAYPDALMQPSDWVFDDFYFANESNSPDSLVSSISSVYDGTKYVLTWAGPKNTSQSYAIYHGASPLKATDGTYNGNGTYGGTSSNPGSTYTGCLWESPTISEVSTYYFLIVPDGQTLGTQIVMTQRS